MFILYNILYEWLTHICVTGIAHHDVYQLHSLLYSLPIRNSKGVSIRMGDTCCCSSYSTVNERHYAVKMRQPLLVVLSVVNEHERVRSADRRIERDKKDPKSKRTKYCNNKRTVLFVSEHDPETF
jgi:hypothetical protein